MKLSFYGAAKEVTGSCFHIEAGTKNIIIDCGLPQGQDEKENKELPFEASKIDAVLLTHAHIDHSGRLPLMVKDGFAGKIYTTGATSKLATILLRDSAYIQKMDAEWENRKGKRAGKDLAVPLYTLEDAEETLKRLVPCKYEEDVNPFENVKVRFTDAGHLLGSSSIQIWLTEDDVTKKIVFSGDIGNIGQPIIRDPQYIEQADYVVMESTYGDRDHEHSGDYVEDLAQIIEQTLGKGGNIIVPAFSVGRTQELLYLIREIKERKLIKSGNDFPVILDSPLSREATRIYDGDLHGYADDETIELLKKGFRPIDFQGLQITESTEESKAINEDPTPKIIISASGMCTAGRIRHHLKHNLWCQECSIVFVGFQARGTLGRMLLDGVKKVKLFGEEIAVRAKIVSFRGLSAHADQTGLLKWVDSYSPKPQKVFVVHGETSVCDIFTDILRERQFKVFTPNFKAVYDLVNDSVISEGILPETIQEEQKVLRSEQIQPGKQKVVVSYAYTRLVDAGEELLETIKKNKSAYNRDLAKLTKQIIALTRKINR